ERRAPYSRLVDSMRRELEGPPVPEPSARRQLRGVTGVIFVLFGLMKASTPAMPILVGARGLEVASGPEGFSLLLGQLGVPFPLFNAWLVILVEVVCGLGLIFSTQLQGTALLTRLFALPLTVDMAVATLVGVRNVLGQPLEVNGHLVMYQPWRLPLELGLLVGMTYLLWRPVARGSSPRSP
ncbi:MAG TPA: DoxX family protein, partial [Myxococcaceae bacterium]|nr:DoxX family protein [Myxococcaceae bacterium]